MKSKKLFKKLSLTFLGLAGLATGTIALIPNNFSNNNQLTLDSSTQQLDVKNTESSNLNVQNNDSYNTFVSEYGYLNVDQSSTLITFSDWFGFTKWTFNINKNSKELFGSQRSTSDIKVRALDDLGTVLVYGDLDSNNSFMFQLNIDNGTIFPRNKNALVGTGSDTTIIPSINVANVTDENKVILSPKINHESNNGTLKIKFSIVDLNTYGDPTNLEYSSTPSANANTINVFYEITGAIEKTGDDGGIYYVFSVKGYNTTNNTSTDNTHTNNLKLMIWMILFRVNNGNYTTDNYSYSAFTNRNDFITISNGDVPVQEYINKKYMEDMEYTTITRYNYEDGSKNWSSILTVIKWKKTWDFQSKFAKNDLYGVSIDSKVTSWSNWASNMLPARPTSFAVGGQADRTSAPVDLVTTQRDGKLRIWAVCYEIGNQSTSNKMALMPIEPTTLSNANITSKYWMDLQTTYEYPEFNVVIIPNKKYTASANILGIVDWNQTGSTTLNSKSFKFLNASTQATLEDVTTYALLNSDEELETIYKDKIEIGIEQQIAKDASAITMNGSPIEVENLNYSNLKISDDLKNVSGTITFDVKSWFNSPNASSSSDYNTSTISRTIRIGDFSNTNSKPNNKTNTSYIFPGLNNDILAFSLIISAALIVAGLGMFTFKHFQNKKTIEE